MSRPAPFHVFTPQRDQPEELEKILVKRHALLDSAVGKIRESVMSPDKHRLLFIGPRGMGKSYLITLIHHRLSMQEDGTMVPFTTRLNDPESGEPGKVIGMTTYCDINAELPRLEIGYTWNAASAQGTGTNPDSKRLLLGHAFETLDCVAVEFSTHWMNMQSREAIARLGAKQDGVLRATSRMPDGSLRDTVIFSIIASEWPQVRSGLDLRLAKKR